MSAVLSDASGEPNATAPNPDAEWFVVAKVATR
jgi:hypothetical protein